MEDVKRVGMNECRWLNCAVKAWPRSIEQLWVLVTRRESDKTPRRLYGMLCK